MSQSNLNKHQFIILNSIIGIQQIQYELVKMPEFYPRNYYLERNCENPGLLSPPLYGTIAAKRLLYLMEALFPAPAGANEKDDILTLRNCRMRVLRREGEYHGEH